MEKKGKILLITSIFLVLTISLFSLNVYADELNISSSLFSGEKSVKSLDEKSFLSPNWAGYIVVKKDSNNQIEEKTVKYVEGTWEVPEVDCSSISTGYVYIWVGIDGYSSSSNTIEQIGTAARCNGGNPSYFAFWEMYPRPVNQISNFQISPGDEVYAKVEFIGKNNFNLSITNLDTGKTFSVVKKMKGTKRSSAEWIVEDPLGIASPGNFPEFDEVTFTNTKAKMKNVQGKTISNPNWVSYEIDMAGDGVLKADASPLMSGGKSFNVTWLHE